MYEKETLTQVFSCEFCEISKNSFLHRTALVTASVIFNDITTEVFRNFQMRRLAKILLSNRI